MCLCLSVHLFVCTSVGLSICVLCLSVHLFVCPSVCLYICISVGSSMRLYLSVSPTVLWSVFLFFGLSSILLLHLCFCLLIYLIVCLSICALIILLAVCLFVCDKRWPDKHKAKANLVRNQNCLSVCLLRNIFIFHKPWRGKAEWQNTRLIIPRLRVRFRTRKWRKKKFLEPFEIHASSSTSSRNVTRFSMVPRHSA